MWIIRFLEDSGSVTKWGSEISMQLMFLEESSSHKRIPTNSTVPTPKEFSGILSINKHTLRVNKVERCMKLLKYTLRLSVGYWFPSSSLSLMMAFPNLEKSGFLLDLGISVGDISLMLDRDLCQFTPKVGQLQPLWEGCLQRCGASLVLVKKIFFSKIMWKICWVGSLQFCGIDSTEAFSSHLVVFLAVSPDGKVIKVERSLWGNLRIYTNVEIVEWWLQNHLTCVVAML